jgi:membrane protease YdiL (CAAX protease family)
VTWLDVILFLILAIGIPWAIWLRLGLGSKASALAMVAPGCIALALMLTLSPMKLWDSPLVRFGPPEYALLAWAVPVLWVTVLAGLSLQLGMAKPSLTFADPKDRAQVIARLVLAGSLGILLGLVWLWRCLPWGQRIPLGFAPWPSAGLTVAVLFLFFLPVRLLTQALVDREKLNEAATRYLSYVVNVLIAGVLLPVLGEELAWRGFLFPRLADCNIHLALIGTLVAWLLFHAPLGFLSPSLRDVPRQALCASVLVIAGPTFFTGWLLLVTGSLWPAVVFHLTWNLVNTAVLGSIYTGREGLLRGRIWLINGEGVMGLTVSLLIIAPTFYYLTLQSV